MPFEPLQTDEKLDGNSTQTRSMDDVMLSGCTGFVGASLVTFVLGVWPFLALGGGADPGRLVWAFPLGLVPALAFGGYVCKRFGLAAGCGFIGGAMAIGVFMRLIGNQILTAIFVANGARSVPPLILADAIPVAWVLISVGVGYGLLPNSELRDAFRSKKP